MENLVSAYTSIVPCRSKWSGVTFNTALTSGWKSIVVSNATEVNGIPMLPTTNTDL